MTQMPNELSRQTEEATGICLGHPSHPTQAEEVICRICGNLVAGVSLGVYQVQHLLGSGRNGKAYLATHLRSRQPVVIKLFPPDPTSMGLWDGARREVRIATTLRHPSLLPVFSSTTWQPGVHPGTTRPLHELMTAYPEQETFLLTLRQYVPSTLAHFIAHYEKNEVHLSLRRRGIEPLSHLLHLLHQAGSALSAAHARGLVHGSLVPGNVLVDNQEHLWVADLGLSRLHPPPAPYLAPELYGVSRACIQAGNMAPFWNAATPASDQYMLAILCQQLFARLLRPIDYDFLLPVLQCASNPKPTQRFASMDIFLHELATQSIRSHALPSTHSSGIHGEIRQIQQQATTLADRHPQEQYNKTINYQLASSLPESPVDDWEKLGGKLFTSHDYSGAVKAYLRALELDGKRATTWLALGDAYFALEKYADALGTYEQALQLNPNDSLAWSNRGTALDALGRRKEAVECYERADQLNA